MNSLSNSFNGFSNTLNSKTASFTNDVNFSKTLVAAFSLLLLTGLSAAAGADFSSYSQPDPSNFDYAVTSDGTAPSEGDFTDEDSFEKIGEAVQAADDANAGEAKSVLVFSDTTETNIDQS